MKIQDTKTRSLGRREFNTLCAALGLSLPAGSTMLAALSHEAALAAAGGSQSDPRSVKFHDGTLVAAVGQGSWHLAAGRRPAAVEEEALRTGLSLGMTLIDTSGNYSGGHSEELISRAIAGQRHKVFLVSKVETDQVAGAGMARACDASLARLGTTYLDLYLMHWPVSSSQFGGMVAGFERLRAAGKIRRWGVSNFNVRQMEDLFKVGAGDSCATNQVPYSLSDRRIERDLLPWCEQHGMPIMAYSPLGGQGSALVNNPALARIGAAHNCSAAAVALAWTIRGGNFIAIPESGSAAHVTENAVALSMVLTPEELQMLDADFPTH